MSFLTFIAAQVSDSTLWPAVADAVAKATILFGVAGAVTAALHRASAATRHFVWTLALISALALPALSVTLPRWEMPVVTLAPPVAAPVPAVQADDNANRVSPPLRHEPARRAPAAVPTAAAASAPQTAQPIQDLINRVSWPAILFAVWAVGMLAIVSRVALGVIAVQWMSRRTERVTDASWLPLARQLAREIGAPGDTAFLRSAAATMPMAWGIFRPCVLMPADADSWPVERLRIVLLHELAHVKRRDCLTHMIGQLACALYWFNPLAWIAARHVRTERERACDDLVLASGTHGPDYAEELLEMARVMRAGRFPAVLAGATLAMAHRSQLEGRLIAILDPKVRRAGLTRLRLLAGTAMFGCAVMPLASMQPWTYAEADVRQTPPQEVAAPQKPVPEPQANPVPVAPSMPQRAQTDQDAHAHQDPARIRSIAPAIADAINDSSAQAVVQGMTQSVTQGITQGMIQGMVQGIVQPMLAGGGGPQEHGGGQKGSADPKTVAALTAALKDADKGVRETALHALVNMRDPSIFEPLVQALRDAAADVREQAAFGLGQLRDRRAVDPLTAALKDQNPSVREQAVFALGQLRDPRAVDSVIAGLKDENPSVREQAAFALGQIRSAAAVDALSAALKDQNGSVREQAAFALGQIRDRRAAQALAAALKDTDDDVREQAVFALGQLRDASAIEGLTAALHDAKPDVREQAAFALGQIRDPKAVSALISALKDADPDVRQQAAFALGQIRDRAAVEALVIALKDADADVREQAAFALGQLRDARAIDGLTEALKDANASVRQQAAFALGQLAR